jgi:hypothetical protein
MGGEEPRPRDLADSVLGCQLQLNGVTGPRYNAELRYHIASSNSGLSSIS